jgi:hypothetical protein
LKILNQNKITPFGKDFFFFGEIKNKSFIIFGLETAK